MSDLSTCGRCGGTIRRSPGAPTGYVHVVGPSDRHLPDPDDSHVSGPSRSDLPACPSCGHPPHDEPGEELCEERIPTGILDRETGEPETRWCPCDGPRCAYCKRVPADGERHGLLDGTTDDGEPLGFTCLGADGEVIFDPPPPYTGPDPWTNPDAAALAGPPPF